MGTKRNIPNTTWASLQADPDAWLQIPEFGVNPVEVDFVGFAFPIFGRSYLCGWESPIKDSVKEIREIAQERFGTQRAIKEAYLRLLNKFGSESLYFQRNEIYSLDDVTEEEAFSYWYIAYFNDLKFLFKQIDEEENDSEIWIAHAMRSAMRLVSPTQSFKRKVKAEIARSGAIARHANDPKQEVKARVYECWLRWKEESSLYKSKSAFAKDMMSKWDELESQKVIAERWLSDWEKGINLPLKPTLLE